MKLLTYFVFTLLSVVIQFCVMDFIQGQVDLNEKPIPFQEIAKSEKKSLGIYKDHIGKDHALYYRLNKNRDYEESQVLPETKYLNSSLDIFLTTESSFTVFDILYDENISTTDAAFTSDTFFTSTELDNATDIALFEKKNSTTAKSNTVRKTSKDTHICHCNLLYNQCDINCCCDDDCSIADKKLYRKCEMVNFVYPYKNHQGQLTCDEMETAEFTGGFRNLFCIAKTNLPEKNFLLKPKIHNPEVNNVYLWHENFIIADTIKFNFDRQHVWLLKNRSIYYLDLPASITNNYCSIRHPMIFMRNENIQCHVKLKDLEMFRIVKTFSESSVISAVNNSLNSTAMNCSSFYCTNWTMSYCDQNDCTTYSKSAHEPVCAGNWCYNVALKLEYIFNIYDSKIVNASINFYIQNISTILGVETYVTQEVIVNFFIGNISLGRVIKLSGNPGYITGSPVITSFSELNHTNNFFNNSIDRPHLSHADNKGGFCILSRFIKKEVEFGVNKRTKCKISLTPILTTDATEACIKIQNNINKLLCVNRKLYISPYGNPEGVKDDDWLPINLENVLVYGKLHPQNSKLLCFNLQTRVALIFTYVNLKFNRGTSENKLLSVRMKGFGKNMTFSTGEPSTVITIDVNFVNVNKLTRPRIAEVPHLNLNLPKDFFFPFPSNECHTHKSIKILLILLCIIALLTK